MIFVELSEFSDGNEDELQLLAANDIPPRTVIAQPTGRVVHKATKYSIRLSNFRHLLMDDGDGSNNSVFQRINHSFTPNCIAIPDDKDDKVVFETLRMIERGEPLSFDYTSTESEQFAAPFVDVETGRDVGQ